MQTTIWWWILWILILGYPWPWGQLKIKTKPFNIFLLQINRSINSLSMTTIISNRSIGGMHAFPGRAAHMPVGEHKRKSFSVVVGFGCWSLLVCLFFTIESLLPFFLLLWNAIFSSCCHINISCFSSPLSLLVKRAGDLLKILLYLFQESSSAGRTIDSSSFSFLSFLSFFCPDQHWRKIGRAAWSMYIYTPRARERAGESACVTCRKLFRSTTHMWTHMCVGRLFLPPWLSVCHKSMRCSYSRASSETGKKPKCWGVGKVWKYCSVLNRNINPSKNSPLGIAKAFKEML